MCHKLAEHCVRRDNLENGLLLVEQALQVWNADKSVYQPEIARTTFLKAKIVYRLGRDHEASVLFNSAAKSWSLLAGRSMINYRDLVEDDFTELVTFWSR